MVTYGLDTSIVLRFLDGKPGLDEMRTILVGIGYADSFGVQLAQISADHILITADYGVKPAKQLLRIQFLPTKSTS